MNKILVTGGSGFIGSSLVADLAKGNQPFYYSYRTEPLEIYAENALQLDLLDPQSFTAQADRLSEVTELIHTAAVVPAKGSTHDKWEDFDNQITHSVAMLRNLLSHLPQLRTIVFISSCYIENSDPSIGFYGVGKFAVEQALHRFAQLQDINSVALRFPQLYGPGETHGMYVNKFVRLALDSQTIQLDERAYVKKDLLYIGDVVACIKHALTLTGRHTVTVSSERPYSAVEVAEDVVAVVGAGQVEKPEAPSSVVSDTALHFAGDYLRLGFSLQYPLQAGLEQTINYYRGRTSV